MTDQFGQHLELLLAEHLRKGEAFNADALLLMIIQANAEATADSAAEADHELQAAKDWLITQLDTQHGISLFGHHASAILDELERPRNKPHILGPAIQYDDLIVSLPRPATQMDVWHKMAGFLHYHARALPHVFGYLTNEGFKTVEECRQSGIADGY